MTKFRAIQGFTLQAQYLAAYDPLAGDGADRKLLFDSRTITHQTLNTRFHFRKFACFGLYTTSGFQIPRLRLKQLCSNAVVTELEMMSAMASLISTFSTMTALSLWFG